MDFPIAFGFMIQCKVILCIHRTAQEALCWISVKTLLPHTEKEADLFKALDHELKVLFLLRVTQKIVLNLLLQHFYAQCMYGSSSTIAPPHC